MATCAHSGQAVRHGRRALPARWREPRDLLEPARMRELQRHLLRAGQFIPGRGLEGIRRTSPAVRKWTASSELALSPRPLRRNPAAHRILGHDAAGFRRPDARGRSALDASAPTTLRAELRVSDKPDNHTPDVVLKVLDIPLTAGPHQRVSLDFALRIDDTRYRLRLPAAITRSSPAPSATNA